MEGPRHRRSGGGPHPYQVENDKETGKKSIRALLWQVSSTPKADGDNELHIDIGLILPGKDKEEEMFADDVMEPVAPMEEPIVVSSDDAEPATQADFDEPAPFSAQA